jgi:hypothetical protein
MHMHASDIIFYNGVVVTKHATPIALVVVATANNTSGTSLLYYAV